MKVENITDSLSVFYGNLVSNSRPHFKLFPVPTTGRLNVEYTTPQAGDIQMEILDANGKIMYTEKANVSEGTNTLNMELFDLPGGLYYMTIRDSSGHVQAKPFTKLSP